VGVRRLVQATECGVYDSPSQQRAVQPCTVQVHHGRVALTGGIVERVSEYGRYRPSWIAGILRHAVWSANHMCVEQTIRAWSYDFVVPRTHEGPPLLLLVVVGERTCECLTIDGVGN
jgi:hypothetical protein